jgi:uncharacterized RDD family membrane protein YckC
MGAGDSGAPPPAISAGLRRRVLSLIYEALLLVALIFLSSLPFVMLAHEADRAVARPLFQLYLLAVAAFYFVWQWRSSGQTLAMKTWHVRLVTRECARLSPRQAALRFLFAVPGALLLGVGFLWALVDSEKLFLHDRLAGTIIVRTGE